MNFTHKIISIIILSPAFLLAVSCSKLPFTVQCPSLSCNSNTNVILQKDIPLTITSPGKWCLGEDVTSTGAAAITVTGTTEVTIDLNGYAIDGNNQGLSGIVIQNSTLVNVSNGTIANMSNPSPTDVVATVPPPDTATVIAAIAAATSIEEFRTIFLSNPLINPLPLNPLQFFGIALNNVDTISVNNVVIKSCFVCIGGTGQLNNIIIDNCHGVDYGFNFGPSFGSSPLRGGFVIFFNDAAGASNSISITNCIGNGPESQFGVSLFNTTNVLLSNCQMTAGAGIGVVGLTGTSGFNLGRCTNCLIQNCISYAGQDGFTLAGSSNGFVNNCQAMNYSDEGILGDFSTGFVISNCEVGPSLPNPTPDGAYNSLWNVLIGIGLIGALNGTIENCTIYDNTYDPTLEPIASGIAVEGIDCIVKNNVVYKNNLGFFVSSCQNCVFDNNLINQSALVGIDVGTGFTPLIPNLGNQFTFNQSYNASLADYVGVPNVISVSVNMTNPVAPYVNLMD